MEKVIEFMQIRKAKPNDALKIKQIHNKAYQISYRGYLPDAYLDNLSVQEDDILKMQNYLQTAECYVVVEQEEIIAFAIVDCSFENYFEIQSLYVSPDCQKSGAGTLLVNYLCQNKKQQGHKRCLIWTMDEGPSVGFYEKLYFYRTGNKKMWKFDILIAEMVKIL